MADLVDKDLDKDLDKNPVDNTDLPDGEDEANTEPKEIIFSELSPEIQKFIDQQRTKASDTARKNAVNDPSLREQIRLQAEADAQLTVEQKLELRTAELDKRDNELTARKILMNGGLAGEDLEDALLFVVNNDATKTLELSEKYINSMNRRVDTATELKVASLIKKQPKPKQTHTTAKAFKDMTYSERVEVKQTDPSRFKEEQSKLASKI